MRFYHFVICILFSGTTWGSAPVKGRILLVDNTHIESTTLTRKNHIPEAYPLNPIIRADKPWELNVNGDPYAAPFSGGVWYDEIEEIFKMWYSAGGLKTLGLITCYATSEDGIHWVKPELDIVPGTNIVDTLEHDCVSVLLDKFETDPQKRYKMFSVAFNSRFSVSMYLKYSADGIHWGPTVASSGELYDRCAAYFDPFRQEYVLSLKTLNGMYRRSRNYLSHKDPELLVSLAHRTFDHTSDKYIRYWFHADDDDPRHPDFPDIRPQIYNHEAMPYEGLTLGYFTVWQGPENNICDSLSIQKRNEVLIGWTRDGFNWNRENKTPFIPVNRDYNAWNAGNIQSTNGNPLIVGDSLYFYFSGRYNSKPKHKSNFATGVAKLRRDGFVSMDAGKKEGTLITKPFTLTHPYLFVNADVSGLLAIEILDKDGNPVNGYTKKDCLVLKGIDNTKSPIHWKEEKDLGKLTGQTVRLKFYLMKGSLYSYWLSPWETGESGGYTAGGGPGLSPTGMDIK